jgi:hypothetical protein
MKSELKNEYNEEDTTTIALITSHPLDKEIEGCKGEECLKYLYIKGLTDANTFTTMQIQTFRKDGKVVGVVVYGKNAADLTEIRVHNLDYRLYPNLTIVDGLYTSMDEIKEWESNGGIEGFSERMKDSYGNLDYL